MNFVTTHIHDVESIRVTQEQDHLANECHTTKIRVRVEGLEYEFICYGFRDSVKVEGIRNDDK